MRKESKKLIKLGILVAVAIALFVMTIFFIGSQQYLFTETFTLNVRFNDANGVRKGDFVRYAGVRIGMVSGIEFENDTTVRVEMSIEESMRPYIKKNAMATIASDGLVGSKIINIKAGQPSPDQPMVMVASGDFIQGKNRMDTDEILDQLEELNKDAGRLFDNLSLMSENLTVGKGLMPVLLTDSMLAKDMQDIVSSAKESSEKLSENMEALQHNWLLRGYFKKKKNGKLKNNE